MPPPILALVVGINEYGSDDFDDLKGAVADADAFQSYLENNLQVPPSNITSLRNSAASRSAILQGLERLRDSPKYGKGECAIVIFFAGHGAQSPIPPDWKEWQTSTGKIEQLCPSDIGLPVSNGAQEVVKGIPDRTISALLNHIADIKGNNITVILDCCSSGGINRHADLDSKEFVPRRIDKAPPLTDAVDQAILLKSSTGRGMNTAGGFASKFQGSHVLLAACGREQFAYETRGHKGLFTTALMKILETEDVEKLTYISLMHKIKIVPQQTPHCEGQGVHWRLFNNSGSGADEGLILTLHEKDGPIIVHAGDAQGITQGSRFSIHATNLTDTPSSPNSPLGYMTVKSVDAFEATLDFEADQTFKVPRLSYAKLVNAVSRKIPIYSSDKSWMRTVFPEHVLTQIDAVIVDQSDSASLELTVTDRKVYFDRHDSVVEPYLGTRINHSVDANDIERIRTVVQLYRRFDHQLKRIGPREFHNVWMELKEMKGGLDDYFNQTFEPYGKNLIESNPARVIVNEQADLGMTIFNQTDLPLYPYLFYFDPTDLTILDWYKPPMGGGIGKFSTQVDAPLPPKGRLTLGYGDGGVAPWQFLIPENQVSDLGFFKLFLTTRPTYFESIAQESPFSDDKDEESLLQMRAGKSSGSGPAKEVTWGAQLVTLVQLQDEAAMR